MDRTTVTVTRRVSYDYYLLPNSPCGCWSVVYSLLLTMAIQVMLYGYKLSFLWIGDEPAQPWTRQPPVKRGL